MEMDAKKLDLSHRRDQGEVTACYTSSRRLKA
jgi:hypothetical protein